MSEGAPEPTPFKFERLRPWLVVLTVVAVLYTLEAGRLVFVPLAYAALATAAVWPLHVRMCGRMGRILATTASTLIIVAAMAALGLALAYTSKPAREQWPQLRDDAIELLRHVGVDMSGIDLPYTEGASRLLEFGSGAFLMIGFIVLLLLESSRFNRRLAGIFKERWTVEGGLRDGIAKISSDTARYLVVRTIVGLVTGALVVGGSKLIGLELAWTWGGMNFLLNYIPTIGSVVGVIAPTLYAAGQGGLTFALTAFAVVGGVQLVMGVIVDPLAQGKGLSMSALVVLVAVTFWGWIWGIAGAFIAVPVTTAVARLVGRYDAGAWLERLVLDQPGDQQADREAGRDQRRARKHRKRPTKHEDRAREQPEGSRA